MKIGDKVRFLSETGGGRVSGFQGKDIVLVEDEDGFEIPTSIHDVIVVDADNYDTAHMVALEKKQNEAKQAEHDNRSIRQRLRDTDDDDADYSADIVDKDDDPSDGFTPKPKERSGGDKLSVYLAFVPVDIKNISNTKFEAYIVNDSNYYIHYSYLSAEGAAWTLRSTGEIEPNTKEYIEDVTYADLNQMLHLAVQTIAYKREKTFILKPAISTEFRLDAVKFYKLGSFRDNDFFEQPALLYTVVENDKVRQQFAVNPEQLKKEMYSHEEKPQKAVGQKESARKPLTQRYEPQQSKKRQFKQVLRDDKIVVDLHADQLLETTAGMQPGDILEYQLDVFRRTLEQYKNKKGQKIIFIHGKGEGVLRHNIIHELNYKYKQYQYQDASFQEYGYGATQVTIK